MRRGYLSPPVLIGLAIICFIVAGSIYFHSFLIRKAKNETGPTPSPTVDETANWQTYLNLKYGFSVRYPNDWYLVEPGNDGARSININNYTESQVTKEELEKNSLNPNKISIIIGSYVETIQNNQSITDFLKNTDKWNSAMVGEPNSTENLTISGKPALRLNYRNGPLYVFSNGKYVFYSYFIPENSNHSSIFTMTFSTIQFLDLKQEISLYPQLEWQPPDHDEFQYYDYQKSEPKVTIIKGESIESKPLTGLTEAPHKIAEDLRKYYDEKMTQEGWQADNNVASEGPTGSMWGYKKEAKIIIIKYEIKYSNYPNCDTANTCSFQARIFHN